MTDYIILRNTNTDDETADSWERYTIESASSPRRALTQAKVSEGEYVAVPERSWKPLTVKTEQVTKVTIG